VTVFGAVDRRAVAPWAVIRYLVGIAGLAFSLAALWLSMRAVMGVGGACASGGPYVPAVVCPDVVIALTPLSIFGLFIFGGLAFWGGAGIGAGWAGLVALAWPALFLSLGWNFLEFGLAPPGAEPGELAWGWLICAVVFGIMGGAPLAVGIWGLRQSAGHRSGSGWSTGRRSMVAPRGRYEVSIVDRRAAERNREPTGRDGAGGDGAGGNGAGGDGGNRGVAGRLERLARLHGDGDLTDAEFAAAKRATLDEAGA
jgi:hypothetical protein